MFCLIFNMKTLQLFFCFIKKLFRVSAEVIQKRKSFKFYKKYKKYLQNVSFFTKKDGSSQNKNKK